MSGRHVSIAIVAVAVLLSGCSATRQASELIIEHGRDPGFYVVPDPLPPGRPGSLIRAERLLGAPDDAVAWRVLYHSRDVTGHDIAVSGVVVAPTRPAPEGGNPIVSWGHPTTGAAQKCAPSTGLDPFVTTEGLRDFVNDGFVVTATDYPGMGAAGPPSYLIGTSEGNSVLDAARAARAITDAHAGDKLLLWGHSQGGQAALFAAQDARVYAPELDLLGVAVAAPAAELGALLKDDVVDDSGVTLGAYAFDAYQRVYGQRVNGQRVDGSTAPVTPLTSILTPAGAAATPRMAELCLFGAHATLHAIAAPLVGGYLAHDPTETEPWKSWLSENTPGRTATGVPVLVAQGEQDTLVRPATTTTFVRGLCRTGEHVLYETYPDANHGTIALRALPRVRGWFAALVAGGTVPANCGK